MSVQLNHSVVLNSLEPHGLQHARLPCPSPTPGACSNSSIESVMPSNHLLCRPLLPSIFLSFRVFSKESVLHIRWPKYWSFCFSISPSKEYSGLISFRIDWFDLLLLAILGSQESSPAQQFESISSSVLSLLYGSTLTFIHQFNSGAQSCLTLGVGDGQGSLGCCSPWGHNIHTQLLEKP